MAFDLSNLSNDQGVQLASIGANLAGTGLQYNASQNAAQQQKDAAAAAAKLQTDMRGPWVAAGTQALGTLQTGLAPGGQFSKPFNMADATNTGAMQFAEQQGQEAIGNTAAAQGGLLGTNAQQAAVKFAEQNAAQFQNQAFNQFQTDRLTQLGAQQSLAGIGQTNLNAVADAGSNSLLAAGGAGAAGTVGGANILSQGLSTLGGGVSAYNTLSKLLAPASAVPQTAMNAANAAGATGSGDSIAALNAQMGWTQGAAPAVATPFGMSGGATAASPYGAMSAPSAVPAFTGASGPAIGAGVTGVPGAALPATGSAADAAAYASSAGAPGTAAYQTAMADYTAAMAGQLGGAELAMAGDAAASYAAAADAAAATAATAAAGEGFWATVASYATEMFAFASSFFSDEQMKKDINRVGATDAGVPIYTYQMKSGGLTQMGVMAQELERVNPDAVRMHPSGYRMVDYGKVS